MVFAVDSPLAFGSRELKLFSPFLGYLSLLDKLLSCMCIDSTLSNFHLMEKVMSAYLEQHGQRHAYRAYERKIVEPLYIVSDRLSSFQYRREELVHGNLSVILIESREKSAF